MATYTNAYTLPRMDILACHFEMFLRCINTGESEIQKIVGAVKRRELEAIGIFIQKNGYRTHEVEFAVDWNAYDQQVQMKGEVFNWDIGGWQDGVSVEAYTLAQRMRNLAKQTNATFSSWIRVSPSVRANPVRHQQLCREIGYSFDRHPVPWQSAPREDRLKINYLDEASLIVRQS